MRYFALAVEAGSVSEAARRLELAQTALSIQIRELEREIGVKLFRRHSRGVVPTAAGELLYKRHRELERFLETALKDVRKAGRAAARPLVVGLNPSVMRLIGADLVIESAAVPSLTVRLVEELSFALVGALQRGELDIAFAYDIEARPGIRREAVMEDELLFVTAPGAEGGEGPISFAEAVAHELFFAGERGIVALIRQTAERLSLVPRIVSDIQSVPSIRARIAEGGASLLPYGTAADGVQRGIFSVRRVEKPVLRRTLYVIERAGERITADGEVERFVRRMIASLHKASPYSAILASRFWKPDA